jgi:hypothetical protein
MICKPSAMTSIFVCATRTKRFPITGPRREPTAEEREQRRRDLTWMNHGFGKVERLPGNIGYLEFYNFMDEEVAADTVAAAMNFINGTDALIIENMICDSCAACGLLRLHEFCETAFKEIRAIITSQITLTTRFAFHR